MLHTLLTFLPVAAVLTVTPGVATALVVRSAVRGGRREARTALRQGLLTSLANPKLAVFFVALFPQFVPAGAPVLPSALAMALTVVALDLMWYSAIAYGVARTRRAFTEGAWLQRAEWFTGAVLVGLGVRLALERR